MQSDSDRSQDRFLIALPKQTPVKDVRITVQCKPMQGEVDQACGLVFRYQDANNYYLARSNALEGNVRLYHVRAGRRTQLATWDSRITSGVWHELAIETVGEHIRVLLNDQEVIVRSDATFAVPGAVGLWVKADSVTAFDDFTMKCLRRIIESSLTSALANEFRSSHAAVRHPSAPKP